MRSLIQDEKSNASQTKKRFVTTNLCPNLLKSLSLQDFPPYVGKNHTDRIEYAITKFLEAVAGGGKQVGGACRHGSSKH